jgi:hypothetical protein
MIASTDTLGALSESKESLVEMGVFWLDILLGEILRNKTFLQNCLYYQAISDIKIHRFYFKSTIVFTHADDRFVTKTRN